MVKHFIIFCRMSHVMKRMSLRGDPFTDECGNWRMHTLQTVLAPSIEEVNDIVERLPWNNNNSLIVRRWVMVNINSIQPRRGYRSLPGRVRAVSRREVNVSGSVLHKSKILSWHHIGRHTYDIYVEDGGHNGKWPWNCIVPFRGV